MSTKKITELRKRIELVLSQFDLKPVDFAKSIGVTGSYISQIQSGKNKKLSPTLTKLISILYGIHEEWLQTGEGEMLKQPINNRVRASNLGRNTDVPDLLQAAKRVLESDNPVAFDALERNLRYFDHAVAVEKRLKSVEERLRSLEEKAGDIDQCPSDRADSAG